MKKCLQVLCIAGLALAALYGFFVIANAVSGNWWQYVPKSPGVLQRCWTQTRFYLWGVFKGEREPFPMTREANFNALQAIIYWLVMYLLLPITIVSAFILDSPARRSNFSSALMPTASPPHGAGTGVRQPRSPGDSCASV